MLQFIKSILYGVLLTKKEGGRKIMVRYNRLRNGQRKDTLYTLRYDDRVFFGIARLKNKSDRFDKIYGLQLANNRAHEALIMYKKWGQSQPLPCMTNCGFSSMHTSTPVFEHGSQSGWLPLSEVKKLLKYFRQLGY